VILDTAGENVGPSAHSFMAQRLKLNYFDWGNPDAPLLVLVHGGRDHARSWDWVAGALRRDYHVVAPDLRGHGDSAWAPDGAYIMPHFVYDLAQLIHQQGTDEVTIIAHSLGGAISLRYAGLYPEKVRKIVAIEGMGPSRAESLARLAKPVADRWREWIEERRMLAGRQPRRYASVGDALARMRSENRHLSELQARHLTIHGVARNEDGSYSWKFDNYMRSFSPVDIPVEELHDLWSRIACPALLVYGRDSWATNPLDDGRAEYFRDARVVTIDDAGHWPHHDQFDIFMAEVRAFL
jgi:pimeloyl-ACP methyl ester carboxylesterase